MIQPDMARPTKNRPGIFGANLLRFRNAKGWSQGKLSEESKVSRGAITNLERGEATTPDQDTASRLARALGCTIADLWTEYQQPAAPTTWKSTPTPPPSQAVPESGMLTLGQFLDRPEGGDVRGEIIEVLRDLRQRGHISERDTLERWLERIAIIERHDPDRGGRGGGRDNSPSGGGR
jgi:DNA-binding XRE family transcriptional regulator